MEYKIDMIDWKLVVIATLLLWIWATAGEGDTNNYYNIDTAIIVDSTFEIDTAVLMGDTLYDSSYSWNRLHYRSYDTPDSISLPLISHEHDYCYPVDGTMTSGYGWRWGRSHNGIDIAYNNRDTTRSMFPGVVRYSRRGWNGGYGHLVIIRHFNGLETYYAHHRKLFVGQGDTLQAGDAIGLVGSTGHSTGPHLHLETRFLGVPIDPELIINLDDSTLVSDSINLIKKGRHYITHGI